MASDTFPVYPPGARVRFTMNNLGLIGEPGIVHDGDLGTVLGPAPDEPWLWVEPDRYRERVCPVHR